MKTSITFDKSNSTYNRPSLQIKKSELFKNSSYITWSHKCEENEDENESEPTINQNNAQSNFLRSMSSSSSLAAPLDDSFPSEQSEPAEISPLFEKKANKINHEIYKKIVEIDLWGQKVTSRVS